MKEETFNAEQAMKDLCKELYKSLGFTGDERLEDFETKYVRVNAAPAIFGEGYRKNNPCGHEAQFECEMRKIITIHEKNQRGANFSHCHVNSCNSGKHCNIVWSTSC